MKQFMLEAIKDAKKTKHHFGAVVVKNDKIVGRMGKRPKGDPRYHAETEAIFDACKKLKTRTLKNCTLYSTCEPCVMCFYMAWITGIKKIVYGATLKDSIKFGCNEINITDKYLNKKSKNKITLTPKFMREECLELFT
jgi:guanine deaminase